MTWWDDFSNNLASDLAPLIALFGDAPTKQFLSECVDFVDIVIFATAPIGIVTALVSAIRVRGSPSLRAFVGRAQEGGGNAEAELCSSTSRDVCELYNNGGIARVFGRPKLLEIVFDDQAKGHDFYSDEEPPKAGIYSFAEYISKDDKRTKDEKEWVEENTGQLRQICLERQSTKGKVATKHHKNGFAPNPNLSLNIGIKKLPRAWFIVAAMVGVSLQCGVLIWAAVARYKLPKHFARNDQMDKYATPMTVIGTIFLVLGVGLCAFLVDSSTEERIFTRKKHVSHMYWVQPGNQYLGDQAFDSFVYSDRKDPRPTYTSSRKKPGRTEGGWLIWTTTVLTTLGFVVQFVGLRACHSSVAVAQLGVILFMSIVRSSLRTQRMKQEDNCMIDRPDAYVGHELDWLALYIEPRDELDRSKEAKDSKKGSGSGGEKRNVLRWEIPSSTEVVKSKPRPTKPRTPSPKDTALPGDPKRFNSEAESLEWLKNVYSPGNNGKDCPIPYESARRFLYRSRLARMTTGWDDDQIAVRSIAQKLTKAITETANALTLKSSCIDEWKDVEVLLWPIRIRLTKASPDLTPAVLIKTGASKVMATQDPEHDLGHLIYLALKRPYIDSEQFGAWTVDESELEAVLGLWAWTTNEQIDEQNPDAHSDRTIFRMLSNQSTDVDLKVWQAAGGAPIITMAPSDGRPGDLLCGLHEPGTKISAHSRMRAFKFKRTTPILCAQELYSLFFQSMLKAAVKDIGGKTTIQEGYSFTLANSTISEVQKAFIDNGLGSGDDAFACTIPALILSDKLPSALSTLADARKCAEKYIKNEEWENAQRLLRWALQQCRKITKPTDRDSAFDFENHQRLLILAMCECYRKSLLIPKSSNFGIQGFVNLMGTEISNTEKEIELLARECASKSLDSSANLSSAPSKSRTLTVTIEEYGKAALRLKEIMPNQLGDVSLLEQKLQDEETKALTSSTSSTTMAAGTEIKTAPDNKTGPSLDDKIKMALDKRTALDDDIRTALDGKVNTAFENKDLTETLYLISIIQIAKWKIKLDDALFKASEHGWYTVVRVLVELAANPDNRDNSARTAITHATIGGDLSTFEYLLGQGCYPNFMDTYTRSPLSYAAEKGFIRIVKKLLNDVRVSVDSMDSMGRTPLSWAAEGGHDVVVELLLETGKVDVDAIGRFRQTPLWWAAQQGHESVVKLLLATKKADVNTKNNTGRTPLSCAVELQHEAVVKLLLGTGKADVDVKDNDGVTPLWRTAHWGSEAIMKLMLETSKDVDVKRDDDNITPLYCAVLRGDEAMVKLLLNTKKVDVNVKDNNGETPLSWAAQRSSKAVVKLLLDTKKVDVNVKNEYGQTPLLRAARLGGDEAVVKLLLDTEKVDIDVKDIDGRTPLSGAAERGHEAVVKLLLNTKKVDVNMGDNNDRTPLSWAAMNECEALVKLLLDTKEIDVNAKDKNGQTPLLWAAKEGREAMVKMLLNTNKVDVNVKDKNGRTPLWWAPLNGSEAVVKLLLDTKKVDIDVKDNYGRTPLLMAAEQGHEAIVKLLLDTKKVDINIKDNNSHTPVWYAAVGRPSMPEHRQLGVVKLLLETKKVDVNEKDNTGRTLLWCAATEGREATVVLLLNTKIVDIDVKDNDGRTPLSGAAEKGHDAIVKLLLSTKKVNIDAEDNKGYTPLEWAVRNAPAGREAVIKLLLDTKKVDPDAKRDYGTRLLRMVGTVSGSRTPSGYDWAGKQKRVEAVQELIRIWAYN